jgi:hypothetical protein
MVRLRSGEEHPAIEAHLAKFTSLMPSLALLCHLADVRSAPAGPVVRDAAERAAALCDLLEAHARRVYQAVTAEELRAARSLLAKLRTGKLPARFTARDVYRMGWAGLADREVVEAALAALDDHRWVLQEVIDTGGRPRVEYVAHPSALAEVAA